RLTPNAGSIGNKKFHKEKQIRHDNIQIPKIVVTPPRGYPSRIYNGRGGTAISPEDFDIINNGWGGINSNKVDLFTGRRSSLESYPVDRGLDSSSSSNNNVEYWSFRRPSFDAMLNRRCDSGTEPPRKSSVSYLPYSRLSGESWSYILQKDQSGKYVMTRRPYAKTVDKGKSTSDINKQIDRHNILSKSSEYIYNSKNFKEYHGKNTQLNRHSYLSKSTESISDSKNIMESIARTNKQLDKIAKQLSKSSESISNPHNTKYSKESSKSVLKSDLDKCNSKIYKDLNKPPTGKSNKLKSNNINYGQNKSLNQNTYEDLSRNPSTIKVECSTKNEINKSISKQSSEAQHTTKDSPKITRHNGSSNLYKHNGVYNSKTSLTQSNKDHIIKEEKIESFDNCKQNNSSFIRYEEITKTSKNNMDNNREFIKKSECAHSKRKNSIESISMSSKFDSPKSQRKNVGSSPKITRKTSWTYTPVVSPTGVRSTPNSPSTPRNQRSPSLISDLYKKSNFNSRTNDTYSSLPKPIISSSTNVSSEIPSVKRSLFARKYSIPFLENMIKSSDTPSENKSPCSSPTNIRKYFKRAGSLPISTNSPVKRLIEHFSSKIKDKDKDSNKNQRRNSVQSEPIKDSKKENESDCDSSICDLPLQYFTPTAEELSESADRFEPLSNQWRRPSDSGYTDRGQWPRWSLRGVLTVVPIPDRLGPKPDSAAQYVVKGIHW
ncbi:unnamed protein product, partial [Meganyctiphanes norvegica]